MHMVHASQEKKILKWLCKYDSSLLLMHHRFPTSTINVKRAAHPFSTKNYFGNTQYILVHNGGITNDDELFVKHQELGIKYHSLLQDLTFNDSEALLWDFALYMEGKQDSLTARGGIAFICLKLVKGKLANMYFGRNSYPLNMLRTKEGISLSSEGEGVPIETNQLYNWNYKLKRLTKRMVNIPNYFVSRTTYSSDNFDWKDNYNNDWRDNLQEGNDGWNWRSGNILAKQFGDKFKDKTEYEADPDTQLYLPIGAKTARERFLQRKGNMPTEVEIQVEYEDYLIDAKGNFEQAYWAMEIDYEYYSDLKNTVVNIYNRVLIEKVMEKIYSDPEYITEKSISSIWRK